MKNDFEYIVLDSNEASVKRYLGAGKHVEVPDRIGGLPVVAVEAQAFAETGVLSITFPDTLSTLADDALAGCDALVELALPGKLSVIARGLLGLCPDLQCVMISGATISASLMEAVSNLNGVGIVQRYINGSVEAYIDLELRAISA